MFVCVYAHLDYEKRAEGSDAVTAERDEVCVCVLCLLLVLL